MYAVTTQRSQNNSVVLNIGPSPHCAASFFSCEKQADIDLMKNTEICSHFFGSSTNQFIRKLAF